MRTQGEAQAAGGPLREMCSEATGIGQGWTGHTRYQRDQMHMNGALGSSIHGLDG